jgi:Methyltransferase domain
MRARELIPLSLRREIVRGLWPAREVRLRVEEARGFHFGRRIATGAEDSCGNGRLTRHQTNRLEGYFDGHTVGPGVEKWRHYFDIYTRHFAKFADREVHVVEVGVSSGGSLGMWLDYFGARCRVYGVDINPECKVHETESIKISIGDQADPLFWRWFLREVPRIDILIDDGGHTVHQQTTTFEAVFPHIEPGGVYLCEDVCGTANAFHSYMFGISRHLNAWEGVTTTNLQRMVGSIHHYPFVTVVERPDAAPSKLLAQRRGTEWAQRGW